MSSLLVVSACAGDDPDAQAEPDGGACAASEERSGEATYYAADGSGNCSFPESGESPLLVAALSDGDYAGAAACGACLEATGPEGSVTVRVVDRCPGCEEGDVDLSEDAFARIAPLEAGRVPITWRQVPCEEEGTLSLRFVDGTNPSWTGVQIDRHRHPVESLAYREHSAAHFGARLLSPRTSGEWTEMDRREHNVFVESEGAGGEPMDFRLVDIHGHELVIEGVTPEAEAEIDTGLQLPAC